MHRILTIMILLCAAVFPARASTAGAEAVPLHELRLFVEVMERIKSDYVEEVDDATLMRHAIRGMLRGLDPHSDYLNEDGWSDIEMLTTGRYEGLGIEVTVDEGLLKVVAPIDGGPAKAAGLRPGDTILRIDDTVVQTLEGADAIRLLRGPAGSKVKLQLDRDGVEAPFTVTLTRANISVASARGMLFDERFAYLRLSVFNEHTGAEALKEFDRLSGHSDGIDGVVLDLRSNPGGVLEAAVAVADLFLDDGLIVRAAGRTPAARYERRATEGDIIDGRPMVVLIDGGSASASEIVAGALQHHQRAVVMGEQSFGKGLVQSVLALGPDQGIKLTTARYFTPSGRSINAVGITPDVEVDATPATDPNDDYSLKEALNLLRGMRIMHARAGR
ncbi:MAG: S41 family peptidase [Gammaproteobacteria bacterium]